MKKNDRVILNNKKISWKGTIQDIYINDNIVIYQIAWDNGNLTWELQYSLLQDKQETREIVLKKIID